MHGTQPRSDCRYSAFLSYSHADARDAAWLQRKLETYRLPKARRAARRHSDDPRRLKPVFRDSAELAAAADLDEALLLALAQSDCLIVVCTPDAAKSKWVAREIEAFTALHGREHIVAALFRGEPAEAFPPGLVHVDADGRRHEPIAADFRKEGEGKRLALLKLVARLATVELDTLIQRDANRRTRRLVGLVALVALVAAAMGALAWMAVRAQRGAESERAKAERLVDFMLGDLRDKLRPVGRLDVMTSVNDAALGYFQDQNIARLSDESLARRAKLLRSAGEDDEKRGNLASAERHFQEARRSTAALLVKSVDDPDRIFEHAQSEYFVGFARWRRGDIRGAESSFREYESLVRQLREMDPGNRAYAMEAGYAASNLGALTLRNLGEARRAELLFFKSLVAFQAAAQLRSDDLDAGIAIADAHGWIADAQKLKGNLSGARYHRRIERDLLTSLIANNPSNRELHVEALGNMLATARIEADSGDLRAALMSFAHGRKEAARAAASDPKNSKIREQVRMFELMALDAWLSTPTQSRSGIDRPATILSACDGIAEQSNYEVRDFCNLLSWQEMSVKPTEIQFKILERRWQSVRLSPGWGVDFNKSLNHFRGS